MNLDQLDPWQSEERADSLQLGLDLDDFIAKEAAQSQSSVRKYMLIDPATFTKQDQSGRCLI